MGKANTANVKKVIKYPFKAAKHVLMDMRALCYLLKNKKRKSSGRIKVGFIVQMPEIWDKEVAVYDLMREKDDIETVMLVVPPYDVAKSRIRLSYKDNYFLKKYPEAVKAIDENGKVCDVSSLELDYVFFQRPYDHYLPGKLRSTELVKFTKCCYIPYGYSGSDVFNEGNSNRAFFRNMTYVFLESTYMQDILTGKFALGSKLKLQHFLSIGYPDLEKYSDYSCGGDIKKILWTPRWSYDPKIGGSHFLEYKDLFLELKKEHSEMDFIFRPHPLMFGDLIKNGLASEQELEDYMAKLEEAAVVYDHDSMIEEAIAASDVMITDYSSIMINYFVTGKPIIYCKAQYGLNDDYKKMAEGMYVAENEEDIKKYVDMLIAGNDPKRKKRQEIVDKYKDIHKGSTKRIVKYLMKGIPRT